MKSKLLITLGDSWTEGKGCYTTPYPYDIKHRISNETIHDIINERYNIEQENYHKHSWPNRVGEKLGFDKVINLSCEGTSNSHHVKLFYQFLNKNNFSDSEVLVIWMMTEPTRFSFFIDNNIKDYQPSFSEKTTIASEYLKEIVDINIDPILEQKFYLQSLESFCKTKNVELITTSWHDTLPYLYRCYKSDTYLYKKPIKMQPPKDIGKNDYLINYSYCSHPNENGYEWIANKIVEGIKENHPKWYSETPNPNIEWEWKGLYQREKINIL